MTTFPRDMKVTAIAPWFGSKRNLAPRIVALMRPHRGYWEPFCGSMAVLLAKPQSSMETVNDLHGDLVNMARVIADPQKGVAFYRSLRRFMHVQELYDEARDRVLVGEPAPGGDLARALDFFVVSWMGRAGVAGSKRHSLHWSNRYTHKGGHAATRFASAVDSIPAWRRRLRTVTIVQGDAIELIDRIADDPAHVIYCDSPYFGQDRYQHNVDHDRLAAGLSRFRRAQVLVSYYDDPELLRLYPGWDRREWEVSIATAHQGRRGANNARAVEVVLSNLELPPVDGLLNMQFEHEGAPQT